MRFQALAVSALLSIVRPAVSQQIWDIYATKWDRTHLFTSLKPSSPINFVAKGAIGDADIIIDDGTKYQNMVGFGGSLTDSAAQNFNNLKNSNADNYWSLLGYLFDPTDAKEGAGLSLIRLPIGASDFSNNAYSWNDNSGDTSHSKLSITAPSYVMSVLKDIKSVNPYIKVFLVPWSPPAWMKDSGTMKGGSLAGQYYSSYPTYLLKSVQAVKNAGFNVYAISIQNEPENNNPTYPTCVYSASQNAQIAGALKTLLNNNGLGSVKVLAYEHNWDHASSYPVQELQQAGSLDGASFHCYAGGVSNQDSFHNAFPNKEVHFTECAGTLGSDWWQDIKWYMDNIFTGAVEHWSSSGAMWSFAADSGGGPKLPGTNSCGGAGCRGIVTINGGSWTVNQEFYAMAHAQKAINPKDANGPFGQRIKVSTGGNLSWALRVSAYVTKRANSSDWARYSIVVLNWDDNSSSSWNPVPVKTTIEFRGMQATYTFDVGVTTLWWYAPA
jgi:O-glycosyl hydrolase